MPFTFESLKKDASFYLTVFGVIFTLVVFWNTTTTQISQNDVEIKEIKAELKLQNGKNNQQDLLEIEIKTKLSNIEVTLTEIKQKINK